MSCLICGMPAEEHHYREDAPASGKGMGGAHPHLPVMRLCRRHHEAVHGRTLTLTVEGDKASWEFTGGARGWRALVVSDDTQDPLYASDAALCALWQAGEGMAMGGMVAQARAAYGLYLRYGWEPGWYARAAELIRDTTGCSVAVGTVYNRAAMGIALEVAGDAQQAAEALGPTVLQAVGKAADPRAAVEQAWRGVVDEGRRRTEVAREIARAVSESETTRTCGAHVCRKCGAVWS